MIHHAREFTTTGDVLLQTGTNALVTFQCPPPFTFRIMSTRIALGLLIGPLLALTAQAQISDHLFGISNPANGVFHFSKMELATGSVTHIQIMPFNSYGSNFSSAIDVNEQRYLLCTGDTLYRLDPTGVAPMETIPLPLPASTSLIHIEYDPCDSMIYGILNHPPISIGLARYDRVANSFQTIATLDPLMPFCSCADYTDPLTGVY